VKIRRVRSRFPHTTRGSANLPSDQAKALPRTRAVVFASPQRGTEVFGTHTPRPPMRVRPAPPDQLAVPAQQRRRTHRKACPGAPRQRPGKRRENCPIDGSKLRSPRLPTQDRELVPEHKDLVFLRSLRSAQQDYQLNQATERHVDERPDHKTSGIGERRSYRCPCRRRSPTANRVFEPHGSGVGSRRTSCATRTRWSSPAKASRSTSSSANSGTPTSARRRSTSKESTPRRSSRPSVRDAPR
jgi:hypothetical protein